MSEFFRGVLLAALTLGIGTCAVLNSGCTCEPIVLDVSGKGNSTTEALTVPDWDRVPTTSAPGGDEGGNDDATGEWQLTEEPGEGEGGGSGDDGDSFNVCAFDWPGPFAELDAETLVTLCESVVVCGYDAWGADDVAPCMFTASAWLGDPDAVGNVPTWRLVLHAATSAVVSSYNADPHPWPKPNGHGLDCGECAAEIYGAEFPQDKIGQCGTNVAQIAPWLCWAEGKGL